MPLKDLRVTLLDEADVERGTVSNPMYTSSVGGSGASQADKSSFVEGTSSATPIAGVLNDTPGTDPTEDQAAAIRITAKRAVHVNLRNVAGTEIGTAAAPVRVDPTGSTAQPVSDGGGTLSTDSADGGHVTLGATTDAAATGNGTVIGLLKRVRDLLGTPVALNGTMSPPTTLPFGSLLYGFDGTNWQPTSLYSWASDGRSVTTTFGIATNTMMYGFNPNTDGAASPATGADRFGVNTETLPIGFAARTATVSSSDLTTANYVGAAVILYVTSAPASPATGGLQVRIQGKQFVDGSGQYYYLNSAPTQIQATGVYVYMVGQSVSGGGGDVKQVTQVYLPPKFRVRVEHLDSQSYSYLASVVRSVG